MTRPAADQINALNEDLNVVYSLWLKGAEFRRQPGWWAHMAQHKYIEPSVNPTLVRLAKKGLHFGLAEHVSFTVSGRVRYIYDTSDGFAEDVGVAGEHNVENGGGYLPIHAFTRIVEEEHITCCVVPASGHKRELRYHFDIASKPVDGAVFSHEVQGFPDTYIIGTLVDG